MVVIETVDVPQSAAHIKAVPLTPKGFSKFGSVFSADEQIANTKTAEANQGTAIKLLKVAPVTNNSRDAPSGKVATANWNIFRSFPPKDRLSNEGNKWTFVAKVLERHPYSTQTFVPMGREAKRYGFLVICAPADPENGGLPAYHESEAFLCRGDQSITYGVGVWHAPMITLGPWELLDFAVLVYENGVPEEDCLEVEYKPGFLVDFEI